VISTPHHSHTGIRFRSFFFSSLLLLPALLSAQRLPGNVVPENYKLFLDPDITKRQFSGEETITVRLTAPTAEIVLNSLDLEISSAEVTVAGKTQKAKVTLDAPDEMVRLALAEPAAAGPATLHISFSGKLTEGLRGLYLSRSPRRLYAVTQFEGTYARMMFPCFDEPSYKATFDLTVTADAGDTAISNGRLASDEAMGSRHKLTFATSPRMSTYLVALAIGDWQCLERNVEGTPVRVCSVPEKKDLGHFGLEVAAQSLHFYNQWYGIKYPFGKLDMVAIPDYEWGGMENTAAIFYRDSALLLGEANSSVFSRQGHAQTIAHEIAHQWFGDLVTAAWWDDIWLNEGFASWMSRKPIEAWHPEWHLENEAAASAQQIISLDSLATARPIHGNPRTSPEIKEMFDGITYEKGAAVLRMLEAFVGPEVFRRGVNQYLKEHANGNAKSADLWSAMAKVSGKPVDRIMPGFVLQPGVPVVSVSGPCQNGQFHLKLNQQRFFISPQGLGSEHNQLWTIPVCFKTSSGVRPPCELLTHENQGVSLNRCSSWFVANSDAAGYYRVQYDDPHTLTSIADDAEKELNVPERIELVEDTWALVRAGKTPVGIFLDVVQAMRGERNRLVLGPTSGHLSYLADSIVPGPQKPAFQKYIRDHFASVAAEVGWRPASSDSDEQKALRATLLAILGGADDPGAIAAAREIVRAYLIDPKSVDNTLVNPALGVAAAHGDAALYEQISAALEQPGPPDRYFTLVFALAAFPQPELSTQLLQRVEKGQLRQQIYPAVFSALLANPGSRAAAWNYLKAHWNDLAEKVSSFGGGGAVSALGSFCTATERDDVKHFFTDHRAIGAENALQQSLERIESCIVFKTMQDKNMAEWLQKQQH
jgi:aminopeptidase N/puromycin-sensitive aminopeptidase